MAYQYDPELTPEENELLAILSPYKLINFKDLIVGKEYAYFNTSSAVHQCAVYAGTLQELQPAKVRVSAKAFFKNARCVDPGLASKGEGSIVVPKNILTLASEKTTLFYEEKTDKEQAGGKKSRRGKKSKRNKKQKTKRTKRRR